MKLELNYSKNKGFRLLRIYEQLTRGNGVDKKALSEELKVSDKTIQRDLNRLREYFAENHFDEGEISIEYNKSKKLYYLIGFQRKWLSDKEALAISKVLLESRAFEKSELEKMLNTLREHISPHEQKHIKNLIDKEFRQYVPLRHGKKLLEPIWKLSQSIAQKQIIKILYTRKDGKPVTHLVNPVAIMFSEYYFYLIAFMSDGSKDYPTVFRIDRIKKIIETGNDFDDTPYEDQFDDGEFRKRVQFMYSGELRRVMFEYSGASIEAVLDRLPTAQVLSEKDGVYTVRAEVYGSGIDMWLNSQGDSVKIIQEK